MKKSKKNNFTNALGAEMLSRKLTDKANEIAKKSASEEQNFFMPDTEKIEAIAETVAPTKPLVRKIVPDLPTQNPKSKKTKKNSSKNISEQKVSVEKILNQKISENKVEAESEFEKRVFAEAENDFFDEKVPQNIGKNIRSRFKEKISEVEETKSARPLFHNKILEKQFEDEDNLESAEYPPEYDPELYRKLSRAEIAGVGLSTLIMLYAFHNLDKPLFFLALSLFVHLMRPLIGGLSGKYNRAVQNAMRSFSLVLFVGALIFLFMMS